MEEVYFDELFIYLEKIRKRKVTEWLMLLQIAQNPHIVNDEDRRALWDQLQEMYTGETQEDRSAETDVLGMERLKFLMSANPRIVVK